jgi:hypothetical protein
MQELEVDAELQRGLLPGAVALAAKFGPTVKSVLYRTFETVFLPRHLPAPPFLLLSRTSFPNHLPPLLSSPTGQDNRGMERAWGGR